MSDANTNLGWALTALLRDYLKQVDLVLADLSGGARGFMVLSAIAQEGCNSQIALAERLGLDRTTMTYLLDGLEREDLLKRTPDPADRRMRHVNLTPEGVARLATLGREVDLVEAKVLHRLERDEIAHLIPLLTRAAGLAPDTGATDMCRAILETKDQMTKA